MAQVDFKELERDHPDARRRRLLFRCWHRGTQESDLILGPFAETSLACFDSSQLDRFEALLDCTDPDLFDWILGGCHAAPGTRSRRDAAAARFLRRAPSRDRSTTDSITSENAGAIRPWNRPLSPFMFPTWYRFQITSALSILHRLTGIALAVGSILLAWWLVSVAAGGELFAATHAFIASPIGMLLLFGWSVAFFYHLCNGIRHLAWDAGYGFELRQAYRSGYAVLAATALLTVLTWLYVLLA